MKNQPCCGSRASSFSRRALLGGSASLATLAALSKNARAGTTSKPVLIQVFLRFGMDGLSAVVPYGDGSLYTLRPTLAIQPPGPSDGAIDLDGFFGLNPGAATLLTPYNNGHLAIVHASGSTDTTRSHFEAMDLMEHGDPSVTPGTVSSGWAARYLIETAASATGSLRGIGLGDWPLTLNQAPQSLPVRDFYFSFPGRGTTSTIRQSALEEAYERRPPFIASPAIDTIATFGFAGIDFSAYTPENGAQYPNSPFGRDVKNIACLLKQAVGVEVVSIDYPDWDMHANLGPTDGQMFGQIRDLSRTLEAFYTDMLGRLDEYVLVCVSEFGRHARENGSYGVDHGHGNAMFVMGGHVNGGQVRADWPGLGPGELDHGDLAVTIDYRDVLGEILLERLGVTDLAPIFPGHTYVPRGLVT